MVTKKHLQQIHLPSFHSASSQGSPSAQPSFSQSTDSQPTEAAAQPSSVVSELSDAYSFHIQPQTIQPQDIQSRIQAKPQGRSPATDSSKILSPEIKRTAPPRENRNPAIALLKDALKPDSPTLPAFDKELLQQLHQERPPQENGVAAEPHLSSQAHSSQSHSSQSHLDSPPAYPQSSQRRSLRWHKQRRLRSKRRRQSLRPDWVRHVWMLRPSFKPTLKRPKFSKPNFGKLKFGKLKFRTPQSSQPNATPPPKPVAPQPVAPPPLTPEQIEALLQERRQRQAQSRLWSLIWILGLMVLGSMGGIAYSLLTQLPPATNCEGMSPLASDGERLHCAQTAAQSGDRADLIAGIQLIQDWQPSHPMYRKAQVSMNEWSAALLNEAKRVLQEDGLEPAVEIAAHIPPESPLYEEAQERIQVWQQEWQQGEAIYEKAIAAMSEQAWGVASAQIQALGQLDLPYWKQQRANDLSLQILHEQEAYQLLQAAQQRVEDDPTQLVAALKEVQAISSETLVSDEAQALTQEWGEILVAEGIEALDSGDLNRALELVESIPLEQIEQPIALDLVQLSQAQELAKLDHSHWRTNPVGIWRLMEAIAAAKTITPESLLYGAAQDAIAQWQDELEDLTQLQMAQWIASTGSRYALDLATLQAEAVKPGRPRRVQAQTLIAHWRQETQRILDRPLLARAVVIAEAGTLERFREAIAQVQSIGPERAIFPQVEQAIAQWTEQIQAIEDGPILEEARQLAAQEQWEEAIAKAETIGAERALHDIAQNNVAEWRSKLQLEIDQRWLAEARSLAQRRRLTNAIHIASQIQPGQPLYAEAQSGISQWVEEREATQVRQAPQPSTPEARPTSNRSSSPSSSPAPVPQPPSAPPASGNYDGYFDSRYYDNP